MKSLFNLFVVVHLLIDLAMPSLPGAFRFNPDESVVGIRVQSVQTQPLGPALKADLLGKSVALPRLDTKTTAEPQGETDALRVVVLLPRRDPSSDRSAQRLSEAD